MYNRLSSLLSELEPYEQRLIQLNKKMKLKMCKEQESYEEEPEDKDEVLRHLRRREIMTFTECINCSKYVTGSRL